MASCSCSMLLNPTPGCETIGWRPHSRTGSGESAACVFRRTRRRSHRVFPGTRWPTCLHVLGIAAHWQKLRRRCAGESRACFEWKMQPLTEDVVAAAIRETLTTPEARIEILAISKGEVPAGKLDISLSGLSAATNRRSGYAGYLARRGAVPQTRTSSPCGPA